MSFVGIVTNTKNQTYIEKALEGIFENKQIIFITDKSIENIKNVQFETLVIDTNIRQERYLRGLLSKVKYVILNADIMIDRSIWTDLNLIVISYGFHNKATFAVSSVSENSAIICLQRIIKDIYGTKFEPQEFEMKVDESIDIHVIICLKILLLIYHKIHILVN